MIDPSYSTTAFKLEYSGPVVDSFRIFDADSQSPDYTNSRTVNVEMAESALEGTITNWLINESNQQPNKDDFILTQRPATYTITGDEGEVSIYAWVLNDLGQISDLTENSYAVIILDTKQPTGSIVINEDKPYANSTSVSVALNAIDTDGGSGIDKMQFSEDNQNWIDPEDYVATKTWNFTEGDGTKALYVKFSDKAGNWSEVYSDAIILDTTAPITTDSGIDGNWHNTDVTVTLIASDSTSGVAHTYYTTDGTDPSVSLTEYTAPFTLSGEGQYTIKYFSVDNAGNTESIKTASNPVKIDKTAPINCAITINNQDTSVNSWDVTLTLFADDSVSGMGAGAGMKFSNDNIVWSNPEDYATTKYWKLSDGFGTKTVYVKFKDVAENWSESVSDTINVISIPKERIYIYFNNQRIAMEENNEKFFFHNDHLGSTSVITDESGTQVKYLDYQPYGQTKAEEGSLTVGKKFTGKELDDSTGLYDYGARMYDANIKRFISADTIDPRPENPQSLNRYSYCLNNPLKYVDPGGHSPLLVALYSYIIAVISAPDFYQDIQQLVLDAQTADITGMAIDLISAALPGLSASTANIGRKAFSGAIEMASKAADKMGDAGRVAKNVTKSKEKRIVIGESVERLERKAKEIGAKIYAPKKSIEEIGEKKAWRNNAQWYRYHRDKGYKIYDYGLDPERVGSRGPWYQKENKLTEKWLKEGKFNPGQYKKIKD